MTQIGTVYAQGLYALAKEEQLEGKILEELEYLQNIFAQETGYIALLASPNLSKEERTGLLDEAFRGKLQPYLLNFLKLLTEKGYIRHFSDCVEAYRTLYNQDNGILSVTAVTAVALTEAQTAKLTEKLQSITGKRIALTSKLDPEVLGGMRLDYDGKRVDDTVSHRLDAVRNLLKNTVL